MKDKPVILIVDDEPQNVELLEAHLAPRGYEIVTASTGEDALEKLAGHPIDLILLDVMMPGMDGFEVIRRVRQDDTYRLLPIIVVTALRETDARLKGIEAGCDDFISKPIDKMELLARVRSLLKVKAYNDLLSNYQKELESEVARKIEELKHALENLQADIIKRKETEEQLRQAYIVLHETKEQLIQAGKLAAVGTLAAGVAHEILNPLNIIALGIAALEVTQDLPAPVKDAFAIFERQIDRVVRIAKDLQQFSRKSVKETELSDLRALVQDTLTLCGPRIKMERLNVVMDCDGAIPEIPLDKQQIGQVFLNIINNAIDAMGDKDKKELRVEMKSLQEGKGHANRVVISFADRGQGIRPEDLDHLFEPFFTTKGAGQGTGLGLSISHGIVQTHGGRIWAENNPEGGATFYIELPLAACKSSEER